MAGGGRSKLVRCVAACLLVSWHGLESKEHKGEKEARGNKMSPIVLQNLATVLEHGYIERRTRGTHFAWFGSERGSVNDE